MHSVMRYASLLFMIKGTAFEGIKLCFEVCKAVL